MDGARWRRRSGLGVALAAATAVVAGACATWRPTALPAPGAQGTAAAAPTRLVLRDGRRVTLQALRVEGDSVVGVRVGAWGRPERVAVAAGDVARIERRDAAAADRAGLSVIVGIGAAAAAATIYALWLYVRS